MLVYSEDLLVEHLAGAISSVGTEWQKGNRMERKKQNMLTMQKSKSKIRNELNTRRTKQTNKQKKRGEDDVPPPTPPPPDRCVGVENSKNTQKSKGNILRRMVDGMRMASSMRLKQESTHEILKPNDTFLPPPHPPTKKKLYSCSTEVADK